MSSAPQSYYPKTSPSILGGHPASHQRRHSLGWVNSVPKQKDVIAMNPLLVASGKGCHDKFITGGSSSAPESELEISLRLVWCQEMESCADPQPLLRLWRSEMLSESTCKSKPRDIIRSLQHWHRVDVFTLLSMLVVAAMLVMMAPPESFDSSRP